MFSRLSLRVHCVLLGLAVTLCSGALIFASGRELQKAPDFVLSDVGGNKVRLYDFTGKVVLLNFWATWCAPCRDEIPGLNRLFDSMQKKDFVILSVSIDRSVQDLKRFLKDTPIHYPLLIDSDGEVFVKKYSVPGLPTSFIINREGFIVERVTGQRQWDSREFLEKIRKMVYIK